MLTMTYRLLEGTVNPEAPLIYMWEIRNGTGEVTGRYIGKANGGDKRPTRHYSRNVNRFLRGEPYRNGKPYRRVHVALANATKAEHEITLSYLCNVPSGEDIFSVETSYIHEYECDADDGIGLNGRWKSAPPALPEPTQMPLVANGSTEDDSPADLEDFVEYITEHYPDRFRIESTPLRYSLYIDDVRVLRAKVGRGRTRVYVKCVRRKGIGNDPVEFVWDGTDQQLAEVVDRELRLFDGTC